MIGLFIILGFGLVLRLISLNQSLWLDEATTAMVSNMSISDIFRNFLPGDFHPPLYYLVLKGWVSVFGSGEISLRLPSVIFGVATIFIIYKLAKEIFDIKVATVASLLAATSGLLVYYSQEARMYSLAAFLVALSVWLFVRKKWPALGITLLLLGMTDYVSLLILPVFWMLSKKEVKSLVFSYGPLILVFGMWLPVFARQLTAGLGVAGTAWGSILGPATVKNVLLIPTKFILGRVSIDNNLHYLLLVAICSIVFLKILYFAKNESKIIRYWLVAPIILGILLSFKIPTLSYFRFIFCLPALYILLAKGLTMAGRYQKVLTVFVLSVNLVSTVSYLYIPGFHREDWRSAVEFIETSKTSESVTLFVTKSNWEAYRYYASDAKIADSEALAQRFDQIWLMRYVQDVFDPDDVTRSKVEGLGYTKEGEYAFNGILVYKYTRPKT